MLHNSRIDLRLLVVLLLLINCLCGLFTHALNVPSEPHPLLFLQGTHEFYHVIKSLHNNYDIIVIMSMYM